MLRFKRTKSLKKDILSDTLLKNSETIMRKETAGESVEIFFGKIIILLQKNNPRNLLMSGVGLTCEGRGSCYDLIFDYEKRKVYSIDRKDEEYICEISCNLVE